MKDPFEVLGVERDATKREIKSAYRKLAKEFHPDLHPDNAAILERFKEINAAYETLSNDSLRKRYGEARMRGTRGAGFTFDSGPDREPEFDERFGKGDTSADLVGDIAGHRRGRGGTSMWIKGEDMFHEITVSFVDAARGVRREVALPTGVALELEIPPATADGAIVKFPRWGYPGYGGGEPGDLNLKVNVTPHPVLRRDGADIRMTLTLSADDAARGATVAVPTVTGDKRLRIRAGTKTCDVIRIKGAGLRAGAGDARGDQLVEVAFAAPQSTVN
jgi:DnaJ-class molecular chaperone